MTALPFPPHDMATRERKETLADSANFTELAMKRIASLKAMTCYDCGGKLQIGQERFWYSSIGIKALECEKCSTYFLPPDWTKSVKLK